VLPFRQAFDKLRIDSAPEDFPLPGLDSLYHRRLEMTNLQECIIKFCVAVWVVWLIPYSSAVLLHKFNNGHRPERRPGVRCEAALEGQLDLMPLRLERVDLWKIHRTTNGTS
jgi:hypothetical protein